MTIRQELQPPARKGRWTIGFVGRSKRTREAAVRTALRPDERAIGRYEVEASRGRGASSGMRFGHRCLLLVTSDRVVALTSNGPQRLTLNPLVLLVSVIVNGLVPVRMPYVLFEAPLRAVGVEKRAGLSGSYLLLQIPEAEWVLRFAQPQEADSFASFVKAG